MIQNLSFSGKEDGNPYLHIRDFEQTYDCLRIEGISDKTLRWKLFPFSLKGEARQWYNQKVSQQRGGWGVLRAVGYFKRKQKNPQAHRYRCRFHPGVFQSIDFSTGNVSVLIKIQDRPRITI